MRGVPRNNETLKGEDRLAARLDRAFKSAWSSYREEFRRCQKKPSGAAVHQLRVATRRLQALVELFGPLQADGAAGIRRLLKRPFKSSGRLRDTQVMLGDVERWLVRFPEAKSFRQALRRREKFLGKRWERKLQRARLKKLEHRLDLLRRRLRAALKQADWRHRALLRLLLRVDRAFAGVVARRRRVTPARTQGIHRTRIAFKQFRYMIEPLQSLLPGLAEGLPEKLRRYQTLMGDIQDSETLLVAVNEFTPDEAGAGRGLARFRAAIKRDHARLIARYLRRADELLSFWQPLAASR